jgi:hypothetical protein
LALYLVLTARTRTCNLPSTKGALYLWSYASEGVGVRVVSMGGIMPAQKKTATLFKGGGFRW